MERDFSVEEYGGCLWLDTEIRTKGGYYWAETEYKIDVDSGRSALQYVLENYDIKRMWLPVYNCPLVAKRIQNVSKVDIVWYNIDKDFRPCINPDTLSEGDAFLWVNYCGVMPETLIDEIASWQDITSAIILIDNIPAYFSKPRMNVLNLYSCRKFIGVPDGGHIIGKGVKHIELPIYSTAENYVYLLKAIETGSNTAYLEYQKSEKRFSEASIAFGMPKLTEKMLENIDYKRIIKKRKDNFIILHEILGNTNGLNVNISTMTPSAYPYLTSNKDLRERLIENKIYVSRFWKHVLTSTYANDFEKNLAEYLIPLPIDQRYSMTDMTYMAKKVLELEKR